MNYRFSKNGFTLVETIVSLLILSVAITGAFALITWNLRSAHAIKNSFIASGLSQEGIELARNLRDEDWFAGNAFGTFGASCASPLPNGTYRVAWDSSGFVCDVTNPQLRLDSNGFYQYTGGTETLFRREVEIERVIPSSGPVVEIIVTVRVSWDDQSGTKEIVAEEHLYNWY